MTFFAVFQSIREQDTPLAASVGDFHSVALTFLTRGVTEEKPERSERLIQRRVLQYLA